VREASPYMNVSLHLGDLFLFNVSEDLTAHLLFSWLRFRLYL